MADEVKELISTRGLVEGGGSTPLREFWGVLDGYNPEESFGNTRVNLNLKDVEVIESVEPYNFPTATIGIKLSNRKSSGWGIFSDSLNAFLTDEEDIKDVIGQRMRLKMEVGHKFGVNRQTNEDMLGDVWHVEEIEGREKKVVEAAGAEASTTSAPKASAAEAKAKELLDGKTLAEFNKAAYTDTAIRKDTAFQRTITDKSFVKALEIAGKFTKDKNGVYHKV